MSRWGAGRPLRLLKSNWDTGVFLLLYFLYVWLVVDPRLIHHAMGILTPYHGVCFKTGFPFFWEHSWRPGGLTEYVTRFVSATYFMGVVGALISTAVAWALCMASDALLRLVNQPRGAVIRYIPALLLLPLYGRYGNPLPAVLPLLVALAGFFLYRRFVSERSSRAIVLIGLATVTVYYVAGSAWVVFTGLAVIDGFLLRRQPRLGWAALLFGFASAWLVGCLVFGLPLAEAYGKPPSADVSIDAWNSLAAFLLYLYFPVVLLGGAIPRLVNERQSTRRQGHKRRSAQSSRSAGIFGMAQRNWGRRDLGLVLVCVLGAFVAWKTFSWPGKISLLVDYLCQQERWPEALAIANRTPQMASNPKFHRNVMLALHHTGRLGDAMFRYPQASSQAAYDLLNSDLDSHTHFQDSRFFFQLGQINLAEKSAYEALTGTGQWPPLLKHLARIHLVKGQPETARIHLEALRQHVFYRRSAAAMLARITTDPGLGSDPEIRRLRTNIPVRDCPTTAIDMEEALLELLEANPGNRMAYDFLMARYLCDLRPDRVVQQLGHWEHFGCGEVPRIYQEAIIIDANRNGQPIPSDDARLEVSTVQRAELFFRVLASTSNRQKAIEVARRLGLGDSYFVFYCFGVSGL